jgi:hypothetical protein
MRFCNNSLNSIPLFCLTCNFRSRGMTQKCHVSHMEITAKVLHTS